MQRGEFSVDQTAEVIHVMSKNIKTASCRFRGQCSVMCNLQLYRVQDFPICRLTDIAHGGLRFEASLSYTVSLSLHVISNRSIDSRKAFTDI